MKKFTFLLLITMSFFVFNSCGDDIEGTEDINYIAFESPTFSAGVDLNGSTDFNITVYTTQVSGSDRTFNVNVLSELSSADPASYSVPSSVTIPANTNVGMLTVNIADLNISENGETLVLGFEATDGLLTGKSITLNVKQVCPLNEVLFDITFDSYPDETSWELLDSNAIVISSGGPYDGQASFAKAFCLENGTYTFILYDAYGDGSGPYKLMYNGSAIIDSTGGFGSSESTTFTVSM